ncbi:MAG: amidohydrolase, partial [Mycobacterium sp.]|nr:amidohydrolase [Mycobacterium sp.]
PLTEDTGLPYTSTNDGVAHACGHDMHVTCLLGAAQLMADSQNHWSGTLIALFQPAEETINGAAGMVSDGLATRIPKVDIALGQHVTPLPAGHLAATAGPAFAAADSIKITLYGRGGHASMPQTTVDPVVLAAAVVMRLQTIVAREIDPADTAVLTVGSILAGTKANIIPDTAEIQINIRSYSETVRTALLDAIRRIVTAECQASNCPREPDIIEYFEHAPLTDNDADVTERVTGAFTGHFGEAVMVPAPKVMGSEDFSDIANGVGAPYCYWLFGGTDPAAFATAFAAGTVTSDIPSNHNPRFAPVIQPTLNTGTAALVAAAMAWLGKDAQGR